MAPRRRRQPRGRGMVLSGRSPWHDRAAARQHHRVHLRARPSGLARGVCLCRNQRRTDCIRQERGEGDHATPRADQVVLTTALGLEFYGIPAQQLEDDAAVTSDTKAGTIFTGTLEAFRRYGVADGVLGKALRVDEIGDIEPATNTARLSVRADLL